MVHGVVQQVLTWYSRYSRGTWCGTAGTHVDSPNDVEGAGPAVPHRRGLSSDAAAEAAAPVAVLGVPPAAGAAW